jgi:hypothetical protein
MNETAVSIIGAGASGLISLNRIVEKFSRRTLEGMGLRVFLFDRSGVFGTGVAYSTPLPSHLLNVRAAGMSAILDDPLHFVKWLQAETPEIRKRYISPIPGRPDASPKVFCRTSRSAFRWTLIPAPSYTETGGPQTLFLPSESLPGESTFLPTPSAKMPGMRILSQNVSWL